MENVAEVYSRLKWLNPAQWSLKSSAGTCSLDGETPKHLLCVFSNYQKVLCLSLMHSYPNLFELKLRGEMRNTFLFNSNKKTLLFGIM